MRKVGSEWLICRQLDINPLMPSHRQGKIPKHRARRPERNSGRRSPLSHANLAKRIARESGPDASEARSWPVTPEAPTQPLPRDGQPAGGEGAGGEGAGGGHSGKRGAASPRRMRGVLVTPWFAAGAGFVIAAALSLNAPRTFLTYRGGGGSTSRCESCQSPESVPTSRPGVQVKSVNPAQVGGTSPAPALVVTIRLGPEHNGVFSVTFILPADQVRNGWKLHFALPGRSISQVIGAKFRPDLAYDAGVAVEPAAQNGYVSPAAPAAMAFLVYAAGPSVAPSGCVLNGQACQFRSP